MGKSSLNSKASPLASDWTARPHQHNLWKYFTVHSVSILGFMHFFSMKGGCRPRISRTQLYLQTQPRLAKQYGVKAWELGLFSKTPDKNTKGDKFHHLPLARDKAFTFPKSKSLFLCSQMPQSGPVKNHFPGSQCFPEASIFQTSETGQLMGSQTCQSSYWKTPYSTGEVLLVRAFHRSSYITCAPKLNSCGLALQRTPQRS